MAEYDFKKIEAFWQLKWRNWNQAGDDIYKVNNLSAKPKCYVLDMFPYPSGAGLHVGHPLGYIATDIYARFKKLKGFEVLHPMGFDAFGLPAEQYAIQTGRHPENTTKENIDRYKLQLNRMGFGYDWSREVRTCDPAYYKYTQWMFIQLFNAWFNSSTQKAEPIETLIAKFEKEGYQGGSDYVLTGDHEAAIPVFSSLEWNAFSETQKNTILLQFRLAYISDAWVNWCPALGTVLANDEVKEGFSERGGYPVERKRMKQWSLRITAYSERLLSGLNTIEWSDSIKDLQRNWIGKSEGCSVQFSLKNNDGFIEVFTTRPDTLFGVSFLTLAPEHELVEILTTEEQKAVVEAYVSQAKNKSERDRQSEVKNMSGVFTGAFAVHPFTGADIPIWIGDYVLSGYGTGAVMAVPAHDSRDYAFAKQFQLPILEVVSGGDISESSYDAKEGILIHSDFLNGLDVKSAIQKAISEVEKRGIGKRAVNFRLRDAAFGRQRYWGEPIPMYYKNGLPYPLPESALPLVLPEVDKFLPTEDGEPPLARAQKWFWDEANQKLVPKDTPGAFPIETTTMPGWAGSSWYFLRYMDPNNSERFASKEVVEYWNQVDVYMGGAEHGTGHLLYVRFWTKVLYDLGLIPFDEPAKKLINQGMIQGVSSMFKSFVGIGHLFENISADVDNMIFSNDFSEEELINKVREELVKRHPETEENAHHWVSPIFSERHADINLLDKEGISPLDFNAFKKWVTNYFQLNQEPKFFTKDGTFRLRTVVEKMSKSKLNVVNPDEVCDLYGADTLRLYEMFLGPIEQHKPWSTQGIEGVYRFLRKLWRLHFDNLDQWVVSDDNPNKDELKILHKLLKKIEHDVLNFSFNTSVSAFMICVNELTDKKCTKRAILEPILIALAPFAPHFCEELWKHLGHTTSIHLQNYPAWDESYLTENEFTYPVSVNGKVRTNLIFGLDMLQQDIESQVLAHPDISKWLEGKPPKKIIFVKGRIINLVV